MTDRTVRGRSTSGAVVRLPRPLHPGAWWLWALGLATAASWTSNPLLLALVLAVIAFVVANRRSGDSSAFGFRVYVILGAVVVGLRLLFRMVLGGADGDTVLFVLPEIPLPEVVAGIRLGGPVSAEALLGAAYDGLRLATLLICLGAANVLADAKRLLKAVPAALHEIGVAVTVALSVAPQLIDSARRIRRARRLRGGGGRRRALRGLLLPVLEDALDRSLRLAAAMDVRGYGRIADVPLRVRRTTGALMLGGLIGASVGTYGLLDGSTPAWLGMPTLLLGAGSAAVGLTIAGRRIRRSVYRPDPWRAPEWTVAATGVAAAALMILNADLDPVALNPATDPPAWPQLPVLGTLAVLLAALPAWLAPPVAVADGPAPDGERERRPAPRRVRDGRAGPDVPPTRVSRPAGSRVDVSDASEVASDVTSDVTSPQTDPRGSELGSVEEARP